MLRARGVHSGFDFLLQPAGFEISEGWLDFELRPALLAGLPGRPDQHAPGRGAGRASIAVLLGTLLGIGRLAPHVLVRGLARCYVQTLRNVPLLVQLLMLYFALTQLLPDSTEPLELLPDVWLSKGGLSLPWPVADAGRLVAERTWSGRSAAASTSAAARR